MLTLYAGASAIPLHNDNYCIKRLWSGLDEVVFNIDVYAPEYQSIQEESSLREESGGTSCLYLVKAIDGGATTATIKAQIDLDEWKSILAINYESASASVGSIVASVAPTGWTVQDDTGFSFRRTIALEAATPLDVVEACRSTFGVTFRFDNVGKTITIINPESYAPVGAFMTRDLNLEEVAYKGKSTTFATRLYAYGKDGLSFASINDDKPYVDDNTYSNRIVCAYWKDERYTVAANLLADAQKRIASMAIPSRSFSCSVLDLAKTNPDVYSFLDFSLFSVVSLVDNTRANVKINHQVVEVWEYPYMQQQNKIILSTVAPRIQSQVTQIQNNITNVNSDWMQQRSAEQQTAIIKATADILGAVGGAVRLLDTNDDGYPDTLYIADDPDPERAVHVWRYNYMGWGASSTGFNGPYTMAATINSGLVADFITAGTINADNINVTNINGQNIKDKTIGTVSIADGAATERVLADGSATENKIGALAVTNVKIGVGAVSYGKTSFTGTLDQVGINQANIATINGYFTGSANFSSLSARNMFLSGYQLVAGSAVNVGDGTTRNLVIWRSS